MFYFSLGLPTTNNTVLSGAFRKRDGRLIQHLALAAVLGGTRLRVRLFCSVLVWYCGELIIETLTPESILSLRINEDDNCPVVKTNNYSNLNKNFETPFPYNFIKPGTLYRIAQKLHNSSNK